MIHQGEAGNGGIQRQVEYPPGAAAVLRAEGGFTETQSTRPVDAVFEDFIREWETRLRVRGACQQNSGD
jgi:hypothetical protein